MPGASPMRLPFDRTRLRERNALDEAQEMEAAKRKTPSQRLAEGLAWSNLARALARAAGARWVLDPEDDRMEKGRRMARPLLVLRDHDRRA